MSKPRKYIADLYGLPDRGNDDDDERYANINKRIQTFPYKTVISSNNNIPRNNCFLSIKTELANMKTAICLLLVAMLAG